MDLDREQMEREVMFNEVIYGLGVLGKTMREAQDERWRGVDLALMYVKAMKDAEA